MRIAGTTGSLALLVLALSCAVVREAEAPSSSEEYVAAGVLPYTIQDGEVWILLGHEPERRYWTDFVGRQKLDDRTPQKTAAREFAEESRLAYTESETLPKILDSDPFVVGGGRVRVWIVDVEWIDGDEIAGYPEVVDYEKDTYCWVRLRRVLDFVDELDLDAFEDCPGERRGLYDLFQANLVRGTTMRAHLDALLEKHP
jgi:hypothetical protein